MENENRIVIADKPYSYKLLKADLKKLKDKYPFITIGTMGSSVMGRDLNYIKLRKR